MKSESKYYNELMKYCTDIKTGKVLSCSLCKKSVNRFLNDIKNQQDDGFPFIASEPENCHIFSVANEWL